MDEYLRLLLGQIRCRKARDMVGKEVKSHILDQAEAYEQAGMERGKALEEAVRDMGDPVEAGAALNRLHRPQTDWRMLALIGAVSILSMLVHAGIGGKGLALGDAYGVRHGIGVLAGYGLMLAVCRMDYSYIGKYAKGIAASFFAAGFLVLLFGRGGSRRDGFLSEVWVSSLWRIWLIFIFRCMAGCFIGIGEKAIRGWENVFCGCCFLCCCFG